MKGAVGQTTYRSNSVQKYQRIEQSANYRKPPLGFQLSLDSVWVTSGHGGYSCRLHAIRQLANLYFVAHPGNSGELLT